MMSAKRGERAVRGPAAHSVLVVEDDPGIGGILESLFESEGYRVRWALRAREALRLAGSERPDLMTLDLNLPDLSVKKSCNTWPRMMSWRVSRSWSSRLTPRACARRPR